MLPRTRAIPKAMLEVCGRPFIDWQLTRLARCGFSEVILCVGHLGEVLRAHVGDGAQFSLQVRWSDDGPRLLGTAGALRAALALLAPTFLLTYGDSYLPFDYGAPLRSLDADVAGDCDGVMSIFHNEGRWDASNVETDGAWVLRYAKGQADAALDHIDYGAMALRRSVIAALPAGEPIGLDAVQQRLAASRRLRAYVATERFYEVGSVRGLEELEALLCASAQQRGTA